MRFLDAVIDRDVPSSREHFDPHSVQDVLTWIAFTDPDDDVSEFADAPSPIVFRVRADQDPKTIDDALEVGEWEVLKSLLRWSLPWTHPNIETGPEALVWRNAIDSETFDRDDPIAFALGDPLAFGRHLLMEDVSLDWIYDRESLAVLFGGWGANDLIPPLAHSDDETFEVLAPMAVTVGWFRVASSPLDTEVLQEIAIDPNRARGFQDAFALCFALDDREDAQNVLVQAAAVSELSARGVDHPAIDGCPGTGSTISEEEADEIDTWDAPQTPEEKARLLIVRSALSRRGFRTDLALPAKKSLGERSLHAIDYAMSVDDPDELLQLFETCDPLLSECMRLLIASWLFCNR